ncbi:MAG: BrnT family toxin [Proteobacteria bacterium]|nr:BrnT family toxin [Pseudomonadota bacterium]
MEFEWNSQKAESNLTKHGVSFHEAGTVFSDPLAITFDDPDHSDGEYRYITLGLSRLNNLLIVSHIERDGKTRIIGARRMTGKERLIYEEK